ncbi:MAG: hypothetical protein QW568_02105 [Candidatus Anstonellaceae archaeon]
MVIFIGLLVVFMAIWANGVSSAKGTLQKNRYEYAALAASDMLVRGPGEPAMWETNVSSLQKIGLARTSNVLSKEKLAAFAEMPYDDVRSLLGVDSDFFFYVEDMGGSRLYEAGRPGAGKATVVVTRFAILDGKNVFVKLNVYGYR